MGATQRRHIRRTRRARTGVLGAFAACLLIAPLTASSDASDDPGSYVQVGAPLSGKAVVSAAGWFGSSVALSAGGQTELVGASPPSGPGSATVLVRRGGGWAVSATLRVDHQGFGASVAISGNGEVVLVGDPEARDNYGSVWRFVDVGGHWTRGSEIVGIGERDKGEFGSSLALSGDGDVALVGAPDDRGNVGSVWALSWARVSSPLREVRISPSTPLVANAGFGTSVAVSRTGSLAIVGSTGAVLTYKPVTGRWVQVGAPLVRPNSSGAFGYPLALSSDGATALIGDGESWGHAWVYERTAGGWDTHAGELTGRDEVSSRGLYGYTLALSGDGDVAVLTAPLRHAGRGGAWAFQRIGSSWAQIGGTIVASGMPASSNGGGFGTSVALDNNANRLAIGDPLAMYSPKTGGIGAVWTFDR